MNYGREYVALLEAVSVSAAKTLIEIGAADDKPVAILRAWITQEVSETSEQLAVLMQRQTATGTGTAHTPAPMSAGDAAFAGTCKINMTVEGTESTNLWREGFNILNGWMWVPTPEERIIIPGNGFFGLNLPTAPGAALTISAGVVFAELG